MTLSVCLSAPRILDSQVDFKTRTQGGMLTMSAKRWFMLDRSKEKIGSLGVVVDHLMIMELVDYSLGGGTAVTKVSIFISSHRVQ